MIVSVRASLLATRNDQLRRQTVTLLFHGLFSTREAVNEMLNPCGIVLHEEFYFSSCISNRKWHWPSLKKCLSCVHFRCSL
mgnify:CR=1 FL=1